MRSASAGKAGYHQWGLDAGDHQDQWWPWNNLESGWHNSDAAASDEDLLKVCPFQQIQLIQADYFLPAQEGPEFEKEPTPSPPSPLPDLPKARPKPKPKKRQRHGVDK